MRSAASVALGLAGLLELASASAIPAETRDFKYPPTQSSKGFRLVVELLHGAKDFTPSIQHQEVVGLHTGAGEAIPGLNAGNKGFIWYQNGTESQVHNGKANILVDIGQPQFPAGLQQVNSPKASELYTLTNNGGPGTEGLQPNPAVEPVPFLLPATYLACNSSLLYYHNEYFITINRTDAEPCPSAPVPEGCTQIRLVPECDTLPPLEEGALSSHEYAQDTKCYEDVSALDWESISEELSKGC